MFKISNAQTPLTNQTITSKREELCISTFRSSIKAHLSLKYYHKVSQFTPFVSKLKHIQDIEHKYMLDRDLEIIKHTLTW